MRVIYSTSTDVYHNLAVEDALLDDASIATPIVYIYRNANAVVLGKNQNPWQECAVGQLDDLGVHLARRVTGGGTVFHDAGNINISCILPRETYSRPDVLQWTMNGLKHLGLNAELANETSIIVGDRKISGNAFCYRRNRVLHHGTLLWDADLDVLHKALAAALRPITTRAIPSVPMPVVNLKELLPDRTPEDLVSAVVNALGEQLDAGPVEIADLQPEQLADRIDKMKAWAWVLGNTPDFEWQWDLDGIETWHIDVHRGVVRSVRGGGDPLVGQRFCSSAFLGVLDDPARMDWLIKYPF